ncbi:MAG: hypothetical protein ACRDHZ_13570 [Ktedonobacteraceae bacterium]
MGDLIEALTVSFWPGIAFSLSIPRRTFNEFFQIFELPREMPVQLSFVG